MTNLHTASKYRYILVAILCVLSLILSPVRIVHADGGDVVCGIFPNPFCIGKSVGADAAKALSDIKITLKLENVDDIKKLVDSTLDKINRLLDTTGDQLRDTLITANEQLQKSAADVNQYLGQRIAQIDEVTQRKLLWIAAYTDQLNKALDDLIHTAGNEIRETMGTAVTGASQLITLSSEEAQKLILRTGEESQKVIYALDRTANGVVANIGTVVKDSIQLTGSELRYTIQTASGEIQTVTKQLSLEIQTILAETEIHITRLVTFTRDALQQVASDLTKDILITQDGLVFIIERSADLILSVASILIGLILTFLAVNGWGRALLRGRFPANRALQISVVILMILSFVAAGIPFVFLSKTVRAYALARPYPTINAQPPGLPARPTPISIVIKPKIASFFPNPIIIQRDVSLNVPYLKVNGSNLSAQDVLSATYGSYVLPSTVTNNDLTVELRLVYEHPEADNSIQINYSGEVLGSVFVEGADRLPQATDTIEPQVQPTNTPTPMPALEVLQSANVRNGPGCYTIIGGANPGATFIITGKSTNSEWWRIDYIDANGQHSEGWIWKGNVNVSNEGIIPTIDLPQYTPCPTSTPTPTNTPVPTETFAPVPPTPTYTPIPASYQLFSSGVDDELVCEVNSIQVLAQRFGDAAIFRDITEFLHPGDNVLRCKVTDNQGGGCYAYGFEVRKNGAVIIPRSVSCCAQSCAKESSTVLDESYIIPFP